MRLLSIIGTRPQIVKASAFSKSIEKTKEIEEILVHTGQHYDKGLSDLFFTAEAYPFPVFIISSI